MSINQNITLYPDTVPDKDTQTPAEFNDNADNYVDWMTGLPAEVNQWATEANNLSTTVNGYESDALAARDTAQTAATNAQNYRDELLSSQIFQATSSTSVDLSASSVSPVILTLAENNRGYSVGSRVRATDTVNPTTNYIEGIVTAYDDSPSSGGTLTIETTSVVGTATVSNWEVNITHGGDANSVAGSTLTEIKSYAFRQAVIFG